VDKEVERALNGVGRFSSEAWGRQVEYSAFRPRGFYADSVGLERYFRARMWWSRYPLRIENDLETRMAVELATVTSVSESYPSLIRISKRLLGSAEDPDLLDLWLAVVEICEPKMASGEGIRGDLPEIVKKLGSTFRPAIRVGDAPNELSRPGRLFGVYVLSPRYLFGSEVFTLTTTPPLLNLRLPKGLDVMSALGSELAESLLLAETLEILRKPLKDSIRVARGWKGREHTVSGIVTVNHRVLDSLLRPPVGPSHPPFMRTEAYKRKSLQTALAAWAEHRSLWILHAKQSSSLFGDFDLKSPAGFVEPNVRFWQLLLDLAVVTRQRLSEFEAVADPRWDELMLTLVRCRTIAESQLAGNDLTREEEEFFASFGKRLALLCGFKLHQDIAVPQAEVADVHREVLNRMVVHVGTGSPQAIYAVYPHRQKNWLCRGGVLTYREHVAANGATLTNEMWREMLKDIPQPEWSTGFALPANHETPRQENNKRIQYE
jgi:hypothetical protein